MEVADCLQFFVIVCLFAYSCRRGRIYIFWGERERETNSKGCSSATRPFRLPHTLKRFCGKWWKHSLTICRRAILNPLQSGRKERQTAGGQRSNRNVAALQVGKYVLSRSCSSSIFKASLLIGASVGTWLNPKCHVGSSQSVNKLHTHTHT